MQKLYMENNNNGGQNFKGGMDGDKQRENANKNGQQQGNQNNPGNFANDPEKASEAGRTGGQN